MAISCSCPQCAAKFRLDDKYAGKNIKCPKCAASMTVPGAGEAPSTVVSRPPTATSIPPKATAARPTPPASSISRPPVPKAPVARPTPSAPSAIPTAEVDEPAPGPMVVVNAPSVAPKKPADTTAPAKKKSNPTLLLVGGGGSVALVLVAVVFMFANPFGGSPKKTPTAKKPGAEKGTSGKDGTLVLTWSESDRSNAQLSIDGRRHSYNSSGPIELTLKPGSHRVSIMRRSFEPVDVQVDVPAGGRAEFTPGWKVVDSALIAANPVPGAAGVKPNEGSSFRPGSAVVPQGFEGWEQSLMAARTRAAQDKKDVLLLFGSSDGSPATVQLAEGLKAAGLPNGELGKKFVPVIIDFPTTREGTNRVNDLQQNGELAKDFRIQSRNELPIVVLADSQGRPYAVERDLDDPQANEIMNTLTAQKAERDRLLAATTTGGPAEKLAGAAAIAEWIEERDFESFYKDDLQTWLAAAKQLDPDNAQGRLEALAECDLVSRLHRIDLRNRVDIVRQLVDTEVWLKRQFVNPDRGARIHLLVGSLLSEYGSEKQGRAHFQRAITYTPKDTTLAERISGLKVFLEHEDVLSTGTGFVIASGGYLLTNKHVIEGPGNLVVRIPGIKEPVAAQVVAQHEKRDIALVKAAFPATFSPEPIAVSPNELSRGLEVGAFGYPQGDVLGESLKFTKGAISATRSRENMILLDVLVNPGNSGGPLCDNQGNAVGMVTAKTNADSDNYGFAIPAAELEEFLSQALPAGAKRSAAATVAKTWDKVDKQISDAVLMLIKTR